jgi:hypothetical protein
MIGRKGRAGRVSPNMQTCLLATAVLTTLPLATLARLCAATSHTEGKIQLQSEGAEILVRRVELQPLK